MFSRVASSTARISRTNFLALKQTTKRASSSANSSGSSVSNVWKWGSVVIVGGAAGWAYMYMTPAKVKLEPAIPTFTGDGEWIDLKLSKVEQLSPNTKLLRFDLPSENHVSGLKVASALLTMYKGPTDEKPTIRPYTPISDENERGSLDLLVKKYNSGPMSEYIHEMIVNQRLAFKGPLPKYEWAPNKHQHIALVAGGTGITPMYQLTRAIFNNPNDKTKVTLVFGNATEQDILLKREFERLENTYPQRFKAFYVLEHAPKGSSWANEGMITKELLKTVLPEPGSGNNKIFVCGPPGMYKAICGPKKSPKDQGDLQGVLRELGYSKDEVYKF